MAFPGSFARTCVGVGGGGTMGALGRRNSFEESPMPSVTRLPDDARDELVARLQRIEGQARGIQKMIEDGRECSEIMNQMASVKAAVNRSEGRRVGKESDMRW